MTVRLCSTLRVSKGFLGCVSFCVLILWYFLVLREWVAAGSPDLSALGRVLLCSENLGSGFPSPGGIFSIASQVSRKF